MMPWRNCWKTLAADSIVLATETVRTLATSLLIVMGEAGHIAT